MVSYCTIQTYSGVTEQHHMLSEAFCLPPLKDDSFQDHLAKWFRVEILDSKLQATAALSLVSIIQISFSHHFNCADAHS